MSIYIFFFLNRFLQFTGYIVVFMFFQQLWTAPYNTHLSFISKIQYSVLYYLIYYFCSRVDYVKLCCDQKLPVVIIRHINFSFSTTPKISHLDKSQTAYNLVMQFCWTSRGNINSRVEYNKGRTQIIIQMIVTLMPKGLSIINL